MRRLWRGLLAGGLVGAGLLMWARRPRQTNWQRHVAQIKRVAGLRSGRRMAQRGHVMMHAARRFFRK